MALDKDDNENYGNSETLMTSPSEIVRTSYKGVEFVVTAGDIIDRLQYVDAMVIPSSPELDLQSGAIENAVYDKYGEGPFEAVNQKKQQRGHRENIEMGEAVGVRHEGKAFIFVNIQPAGEKDNDQTPKGVETSAMSCLAEASDLNCTSIVMPALGNGMWHVPLAISAGSIAHAAKLYIDAMEAQGRPQSLKRIEIVLFRPSPEDRRSIISPVKALNP